VKKPGRAAIASLFALASFSARSRVARAEDNTIRQPGDHPNYAVEIEPHLDLNWFDNVGYGFGGDAGIGLGLRATIPIVKNGFIPSINNTVGIGFGGDILFFGCGAAGCPGVWTLYFPVVLQWNFYVAQRFSVFGEPGFSLDYAFYDNNAAVCQVGGKDVCAFGANFFPGPVFEVGGRYHINEHLALTARIGYPALTFGVSFM
jgi:hypothetical protein